MKTFNYVPCGERFAAIDSKLVKVEIIKVVIDPKFESVVYDIRMNKGGRLVEKDNIFYDSEKAFFKGITSEKRSFSKFDFCQTFGCRNRDEQFVAWVNNDKIAEEITFQVKSITITSDGISFKGVDTNFKEVPNKLYLTRQDVLDNNIVKVVDENGVENEVVGINVKLNLDEEQKSLIEEMKALAQRMNDAGLRLVYNETQEAMAVFNSKNLGNYSYEDQGDCECDHELDYRHVTNVFYPDSVISEYYCICVGKKD